MRRLRCTLQTSVALQVEVRIARISDRGINDRTRLAVPGLVSISLEGEETNVMSLRNNDGSQIELRRRRDTEFERGLFESWADRGEFDFLDGKVLGVTETVTVVKDVFREALIGLEPI